MRSARSLLWIVLLAGTALSVPWLVELNYRLYRPGRVETAIAQLRFLATSLDEGGADRMQAIFPEGYVFTWALYGLASAQVARALPPDDSRRAEALRAARNAVAHVESAHAKETFVRDMEPAFGAFFASWSLYLRSVVLRASRSGDPAPFDLLEYERDRASFAAALTRSSTPFLQSYPGDAWPADTGVGVAALAIGDSVLGQRYRALIARWIVDVRRHLDPRTGAISHAANGLDGTPIGGARGESVALMSLLLADVDRSLAREQYEILRRNFVTYAGGLPGVREFPHGVDGRGDIDSGPLMFGLGGPATVVGAAAAIAHGDDELATSLLATAELAGMPIEIAGQRRYAGGVLPIGDAFLAWARTTSLVSPGAPFDPIVPRWWRIPIHVLSLGLLAGGILAAFGLRQTGPPRRG